MSATLRRTARLTGTSWTRRPPAPARSGLKSVTIVSPLGVYCDALSTAVFVRGADWGADFWRTHQDFEMVLVLEDGSLWVTAGLAGSFTLAEDYQDLEVTVIQL